MSNYAHRLNNRAMSFRQDGSVAVAVAGYRDLLSRNPSEAIRLFRRAIAIDPVFVEAHVGLAIVLLSTGKLLEGWKEYEWRLRRMPPIPAPRWTGRQQLNDHFIVLHAEQGFGDTIQFCRYVPLVAARGGRVVLIAPPPLHRLLAGLEGVDSISTGALPPQYYECSLMSLPLAFGTTLATIPAAVPYLTGDSTPWRGFLDDLPGLKVGLCWAGESKPDYPLDFGTNNLRSMKLADMAPLFDVPGCSFVSLQLGPPSAEMRLLRDGIVLHDVSGKLKDWKDTADLVAGLDLVIAVDTAVCHLAGALGKPIWLLNRHDTEWRWLRNRLDSPWYSTMRIFRQPAPEDWASVVKDVADNLRAITCV